MSIESAVIVLAAVRNPVWLRSPHTPHLTVDSSVICSFTVAAKMLRFVSPHKPAVNESTPVLN